MKLTQLLFGVRAPGAKIGVSQSPTSNILRLSRRVHVPKL